MNEKQPITVSLAATIRQLRERGVNTIETKLERLKLGERLGKIIREHVPFPDKVEGKKITSLLFPGKKYDYDIVKTSPTDCLLNRKLSPTALICEIPLSINQDLEVAILSSAYPFKYKTETPRDVELYMITGSVYPRKTGIQRDVELYIGISHSFCLNPPKERKKGRITDPQRFQKNEPLTMGFMDWKKVDLVDLKDVKMLNKILDLIEKYPDITFYPVPHKFVQ